MLDRRRRVVPARRRRAGSRPAADAPDRRARRGCAARCARSSIPGSSRCGRASRAADRARRRSPARDRPAGRAPRRRWRPANAEAQRRVWLRASIRASESSSLPARRRREPSRPRASSSISVARVPQRRRRRAVGAAVERQVALGHAGLVEALDDASCRAARRRRRPRSPARSSRPRSRRAAASAPCRGSAALAWLPKVIWIAPDSTATELM